MIWNVYIWNEWDINLCFVLNMFVFKWIRIIFMCMWWMDLVIGLEGGNGNGWINVILICFLV